MAAPNQPPRPDDWSDYVANPKEKSGTTFGFPLCALKPGATITAVRPRKTRGDGFVVSGIRMVTFNPGDGYTLASPGFPPAARADEEIKQAVGATPHECSDKRLQSEVQVGMRRMRNDHGGGWDGALVDYTFAGQRFTLEIPFGMLLCGTATDHC